MKRWLKICFQLYDKVSMWGFSGIVHYLIRKIRPNPLKTYFVDNARNYPVNEPEQGITIIGPLSRIGTSLSKVLRDFAYSLKDAGIPFQTFDTGEKQVPESDMDGILTPPSEFRIRRYSHVVEMTFPSPLPDGIVEHRAQIAFWEFNEGIKEAYHCLYDRLDPIIAMSDFNYQYFQREFGEEKQVFKILYPLRMDISKVPDIATCRNQFGFKKGDFLVFYNFAYSSGWWRKNPLDAIRAFAQAFPNPGSEKLVMKTANAQLCRNRENQLLSLAREVGIEDRLVLFNDWMTQRDVYSLTNACDVYLSLHRAEGFGLGLAEAMCLGKAVICTDYSASTEFCKPGISIPIPFELVDITPEEKASHMWYRGVRRWAKPDVTAASEALNRLRHDEMLRNRIGTAAANHIKQQYSIEQFQTSVLSFLKS